MTFEYKKKIYGYECDVYGHLNNAVYLQIYEAARAEALIAMDMPIAKLKELGIAIFVVKAVIEYKKGILLEDTITVKSSCTKFDRLYTIWVQEIYNASGELCSTVEITAAFTKEYKPHRISKELMEHFERVICV